MAEPERERLAKLETQMQEILGNHQPGRLDNVEADVRTHRTWLLLAIGGLYIVQFLGANGLLNFASHLKP